MTSRPLVNYLLHPLGLALVLCALAGCDGPLPEDTTIAPTVTPVATASARTEAGLTSQRLQPTDLEYVGAFRLPDGPEEFGWMYGGAAMAYYPGGDPSSPDDGYPGSIFGTGHDWNQWVSEISIPLPKSPAENDLEALNTAATLQEFHDIRGSLLDWPMEMPRAGLEYLPPQGAQTSGKLYFCWAPHLDEGATHPSHGWCDVDLSRPEPAGPWRIGEYWNYVTADYLFAIPEEWADAYTPGMGLATGRYRDGGQGARGPSLLAIGPWQEGNPPPRGSTIPAIPLLLYSDVTEEGTTLSGYHHSDEWSGGAWLTAGDRSAVVFVGTKGMGDCWYGCADGTVWPEEPPYPPECPERGWWSTRFVGQILFYDPLELGAVARGKIQPDEPQPYATMEIDDFLYHVVSGQQKEHVGAAAFDRERGLLYVFERFGDGDKPLIHVWRVEGP